VKDIVRDSAIVLRVTPFSETSLILTVFSKQNGKVGLLAKGARRKVKNGSALVLEPGYEMEFVWLYKGSRDLQIVRESSLINSHFGIRGSLESTILACTCIELLQRTQSDDDPHPDLYLAASRLLTACESLSTARWPVYWKFHLILLSQLGFALHDPIESKFASAKLSAESLAVLRKLAKSDFDVAQRLRTSPAAEREITRWLTLYLSGHLHIPAQSRSLDAMRWARQSTS